MGDYSHLCYFMNFSSRLGTASHSSGTTASVSESGNKKRLLSEFLSAVFRLNDDRAEQTELQVNDPTSPSVRKPESTAV